MWRVCSQLSRWIHDCLLSACRLRYYNVLQEQYDLDRLKTASLVRFGTFAADLQTGEVRKHGVRLKLQRQPFEVLAALIERPGQLVTREELRRRLWPDGVFVDYDRGLNKAVNRLREVLDDNADKPRFIETIPQRGYRFIGSVELDEPASASAKLESKIEPASSQPIATTRKPRLAAIGLVSAAIALAVFGFYEWRLATPPTVQSIAVLPLENLSGDQSQEF